MKRRFLLGAVFILLAVQTSWGQIPATLSYQGVLRDSDGELLEGSHTLVVRLYEQEQLGQPIWEEQVDSVPLSKGIFNVILGKKVSLAGLAFDKPYWLSVAIDGGGELSPRMELASSAYSLNARVGDGQVVKSVNSLKDDVTLEGGNNISITASGNTLTVSATQSGGTPTQIVFTQSNTFETGGSIIPLDSSVPQISEGFPLFTLSITPKNAASKLIVEAIVIATETADHSNYLLVALFRDDNSNPTDAIAASHVDAWGAHPSGFPRAVPLRTIVDAGSTSPIEFRVNVGCDGGAVNINGRTDGVWGGVLTSSLKITEVLP